jgi:hypothetical protein
MIIRFPLVFNQNESEMLFRFVGFMMQKANRLPVV